MLSRRCGAAAAVMEGQLYVIGGSNGDVPMNTGINKTIRLQIGISYSTYNVRTRVAKSWYLFLHDRCFQKTRLEDSWNQEGSKKCGIHQPEYLGILGKFPEFWNPN